MIFLFLIGATLTLDDALTTTERMQPTVIGAKANYAAADAREKQARGALMPQLSVNGSYSRSTGNFAPRPSAVPNQINTATPPSLQTYDFWNFGATLNQQIFDFQSIIGRYQAQMRLSEASGLTADQALVTAFANTRAAYFGALAQKALVNVANENVESLAKHMEDAQAGAEVGRRPQIDVLQAKQQLSTGKLDRIRAVNNYRLAKLQLNSAMGEQRDVDYDVADTPTLPIDEEGLTADALTDMAVKARKDIAALDAQISAQESVITAQLGRYAPALGLSLTASESGRALSSLVWNLGAQVTLTWTLFSGLQEYYGFREAHATKQSLEAQRTTLVLLACQQVEQAHLTVLSALEAVGAADDALAAARERMTLADARYQTGVGNGLEQIDARFQLTQANAARIQAALDLALARAQLIAALGRVR